MFGDLWGQKASARPTLRGKNVVHSLLQSFDLTRVAKRNEVASEISIGIFVFVTSSDLQVQLVSWNMSSLAHVMTTCGMLRMASCSLHYKATSPYIPRQGMNSRRVFRQKSCPTVSGRYCPRQVQHDFFHASRINFLAFLIR